MINSQSKIASPNLHLLYKLLTRSKANSQTTASGFTLMEMIVVVIIIAVMFGIAAPGWFAFMNRQRLNSAQTEVLQILRETQNLAITRRSSYNASFTVNGAQVSIFRGDGSDNNTINPFKTFTLSPTEDGDVAVQLTTLPAAAPTLIAFNFDGTVQEVGNNVNALNDGSLYKVVVSPAGQTTPRTCVIVDTILGSMREGKNDECNA